MKKTIIGCLALLWLTTPSVAWTQVPHQVGGFVLGEKIAHFKDRVSMETATPIRYQEYLHEVETLNVKGFKSGRISYGMCDQVGRIVQIKLKYADDSRNFYNELLKRYRQQFGKPDKWKGDAFHVIISWKWSFLDRHKNRISLILQHNKRDPSQKLGNVVKLTMVNLIESEHDCFMSKIPPSAGDEKTLSPPQQGPPDWDVLIPR